MEKDSRAGKPSRRQIENELGRLLSLDEGPEAFDRLSSGRRCLFLSLGPRPEQAVELAAGRPARFVECPSFRERLGQGWSPPPAFEALPPEALTDPSVFVDTAVYLYRQAPRLFPSFWGPLLARLELRALADPPARPLVLLPERPDGLIVRELAEAFAASGLDTLRLDAPDMAAELPSLLREHRPSLAFCVNFAGLDALGRAYHLLNAADCKVAVWCVDNPWHLLSGVKSAYWRELRIYVTDASFIEPLRAHGASDVRHLPLAAWKGFAEARPDPSLADLADRAVFVGRSSFPGKAAFFAGCRLDKALWKEARLMIEAGPRPDFAWWSERLAVGELWPGKAARDVGFGAEESGQQLRRRVLEELGRDPGLTVFGDEGWRELSPDLADLRGPVDYYAGLGAIYASAGLCVNCTSPLLPAGLTQRHFDVWSAGGLLLSDATPGLELFPEELWRPMVFQRPQDAPAAARRLLADSSGSRALARAWRELIQAEHGYEQRARTVLEAL